MVALHYPKLVAGVVLGSPSNIVFGALPGNGDSAWTYQGRQVPFASTTHLFDATAPDTPDAVIADGDLRAPLLGVCGTDDQLWGSCAHLQAIAHAITAAHAPHAPIVLQRTGAGHFVGGLLPNLPEYGTTGSDAAGSTYSVGGDQADDEAGRAVAWAKLLSFLAALPAAS